MFGTSRRRRSGVPALLVAALYATAAAWAPIAHAHAEVQQADAAVGTERSHDGPRFHSDALCGIGVHPELAQSAVPDITTPAAGVAAIGLPTMVAPTSGPEHCASLPRAPPTR